MAFALVARLGKAQLALLVYSNHDKSGIFQQGNIPNGLEDSTLGVNSIPAKTGATAAGTNAVSRHTEHYTTTAKEKGNMEMDLHTRRGPACKGHCDVVEVRTFVRHWEGRGESFVCLLLNRGDRRSFNFCGIVISKGNSVSQSL